jgi:hypothetical protein
MRLLTLAVILLAFASGYVCTGQRNLLEIPLDGTYGATVISTAQSLNGVTTTVQATTVGYEICLPASGEVIYGWVDNQTASENTYGEGATAWAAGAGTYYQGVEAVVGCGIHELHWQRYQQWQNAHGDVSDDGQDRGHTCLILVGAAQNEDFFPVMNGCAAPS